MHTLIEILNYFLHIGHHLAEITVKYGMWVYVLLFLIVFCESGIVVAPFLPGDSMLFVTGALTATGVLSPKILIPLLTLAAFLGYWFNYLVGKKLTAKVLEKKQLRFIKGAYIERTQNFYKKYGPKAVVLARFMPITRTFAPFLAGVGLMPFSQFQLYNIVSALLWIPTFIIAGHFFGNIPIVRDNFSTVILLIIVVSILPVVWELIKQKFDRKKEESL